jgi:hypothetical protein
MTQEQQTAENLRSQAHGDAHVAHEIEKARIGWAYADAHDRAQEAFDAAKGTKREIAAAAEFHRIADYPANYRTAATALGATLSKADDDYNATMARLRHEHLTAGKV